MTATKVATTTIPVTRAMWPTCATGLYNATKAIAQALIAIRVWPLKMIGAWKRWPLAIGFEADGTNHETYCAKPMQPEAIESGAERRSCQAYRKAKTLPAPCFP